MFFFRDIGFHVIFLRKVAATAGSWRYPRKSKTIHGGGQIIGKMKICQISQILKSLYLGFLLPMPMNEGNNCLFHKLAGSLASDFILNLSGV